MGRNERRGRMSHINKSVILDNGERWLMERDQARDDLATWKARAEKAEDQLDSVSNVIANIGDTCRARGFPGGLLSSLDQRVIDMIQSSDNAAVTFKHSAEQAQAERDALKSLCEKLKGYVGHKPSCQFLKYVNGPMKKCTCGLDELRKQGEKK